MRTADPARRDAAGPTVDDETVTFRLPDPGRVLRSVRLWQEVRVPGDRLNFARDTADGWVLRLPRPDVDRLEYLFEVTDAAGRRESLPDPGNPVQAPGAFGTKSVLELPGYRAPAWLGRPGPAGSRREVTVSARSTRDDVVAGLWAPAGLADDEPALLLVAHDGPEYDQLAGLTAYLSSLIDAGTLPPLRAALLSPGSRDDRYSANGAYTRALCLAVVPRLRAEVAASAVVGMGASLGALAMLHAQRRQPGTFDGLFLQSGSFFHPRHDAHERRFPHYDRVVRAVAGVLRAGGHPDPVAAVLTCGGLEENLENNRMMARALGAQGYRPAELHELRDVHNYVAWRDAFDPHLTGLLQQVGG